MDMFHGATLKTSLWELKQQQKEKIQLDCHMAATSLAVFFYF